MGDLEKKIDIIFGGKDKVSTTIKGIGKGLDQLEAMTMSVAQPLAQVADGILKTDAALAAMAVGGMALSIKESGKFNDSFKEISTLLDESDETINKFREDILEYAKDSTQSLDGITKATYAAKSAGVELDLVISSLSDAEKLAVAGRAELVDTTVLLAGTLNAYGEGADKASKYSDVFFKTVKLGQTTIPELATSLSKITGIAASTGVSIEELGASVATLTSKSIPTAEAVTSLKAVITNIIKPSEKAKELAEKLGIQFNITGLKSKGLHKFLMDVYTATQGNTQSMTELFGSSEALNAVFALLSDSGKVFTKNLNEITNAAGATQKAFDKMADKFDFVNQKIANNIKLVLIEAGTKLEEHYADVADGVIDIFQGLAKAIKAGAFDDFFDAIESFADAAAKLLSGIGEALPEALEKVDWSGVLDAIRKLGESLGMMFDGVDLTDADDLADVIQDVAEGIEALIRVTTGIVEYFKPFIQVIIDSAKEFNNLDQNSQQAVGNILGAAKAITTFGLEAAAAIVAISKSGADIGRIFDVVIGSMTYLYNTFTGNLRAAALSIVTNLESVIVGFSKVLSYLPGMEGWSKTMSDIAGALDDWRVDLTVSLTKDLQEAGKGLSQVWEGLTGKMEEAGVGVKAYGAAFADVEIEVSAVGKLMDDKLGKDRKPKVKPEVDEEALKKAEKKIDESATKILLKTIEEGAQIQKAKIEADAKVATEAFKTIQTGLTSTGNVVSSIAGDLAAGNMVSRNPVTQAIQRALIEEQTNRREQLAQERLLNEAQARLMNARASAIETGQPVITIQADGLKPHLEAFMWEILEKIQVRANEAAAEFLLGWNT